MSLTDFIRQPNKKASTGGTGVSTGPTDIIELKRDLASPGIESHGALTIGVDNKGKPAVVTYNGRGLPFVVVPIDDQTIKAWHQNWYKHGLQGTILAVKLMAPRLFGGKS